MKNIVQIASRLFSLVKDNFNNGFKKSVFGIVAAAFIVSGFFVSATLAHATIATLSISSPLGGEIWGGVHDINWSATGASTTDTVSIVVSTNNFASTLVTFGQNALSGTYSWNTAIGGLLDGSTYQIKITDGILNANSNIFKLDNTSPTVPTVTYPNGGEVLKGGVSYNITWTPTTDANLGGNPITIQYVNGSTFSFIAQNIANSGSFAWTPNGDTTLGKIHITATDLAGNTSNDVSNNAFTVDSTAPTAVITYSDADGIVKSGDSLIITAIFNEPIAVYPVMQIAITGSNTVGPTVMTSTDSTHYTYTHTVGTGDGPATVALSLGTDIAGNVITSIPTSGATFTVDNIAPSAPLVTLLDPVNSNNQTAVTLTGTGEANASVEYFITDGTKTVINGTGTVNGLGVISLSGINLSALLDGTLNVFVNLTDAAKNMSAEGLDTATKDTSLPTITSITTKDIDLDGKVETATIIFSENVNDSSFSAGNFTIGGSPATSIVTGTSNDNTFDVVVSGGVAGTEAKQVNYNPGIGADTIGNLLNTVKDIHVTEIDEAKPVFMSARTISTTIINLTFSEDLNGSTVTNADFSVTGYTLTAPDASETSPTSGVVRLTVSTPFGTGDTPVVTYNTTVFNGVEDNSNNKATATSLTATDGVVPVLSSVTIASSNTPSIYANVGDIVTVSFTSSEAIGTPTVTISGAPATVAIPTGNNWTASRLMTDADSDGVISFTINFSDTVTPTSNAGTPVSAVTNTSSVLFDKTAPSVDAGTNKTVNVIVTQDATVTDGGSGVATYAWDQISGAEVTFGSATTTEDTTLSASVDGTYVIRLLVTDNAGNAALDVMTLVWDTTAPIITAPLNITTEATANLTPLTLTSATATDTLSGVATITSDTPGTFPVGITTVIWTATDVAGNSATATQTVTITDTTKPSIAAHGNITKEATTASGAVVTYTNPVATDLVNGTVAVSCVSASGSTFPLGSNTVTCTASDALSNIATSTFIIHVVDTTAPEIASHTNINAVANQLGGATVSYTAPNATDAVDPTAPASCTLPSGSVFPIGTTPVTCTKTDVAGNSATPTAFTVTVTHGSITKVFISANPTLLDVSITSTITVTGQDQYGNTVTSDNSTVGVLSADNGGALATTLLTLTSGVKTTTLSKTTAGAVNVNVSSGILTPTQVVVIFSSTSVTPITPTVTINGVAIVPAYTVSEADTRFTNGVQFNTTFADSATVNGLNSPIDGISGIVTAASNSVSKTIGAHTYNVTVTSSTGHTANLSIAYQVNADAITPVLPTVTLSGDEIVTAYTVSEATTRFASGLQFTTTNASSVTVNGLTVTASTTITAATLTQATTLGAHTYNVTVTSSTGHTANLSVTYQVNADPIVFNDTAVLAVTRVALIQNANGNLGLATADNTFENGWRWVFDVTIPTSETELSMKFTDLLSGSNSIAAANNIRFYSVQASDANATSTAVTITHAGDPYSSVMNLMNTDLFPTTPGRQIQVTVEAKVPTGSLGGSYSTSYGIQTL